METKQKNAAPILTVRDLRVSIPMDEGLLTPVRGVNFTIHANETLGLVGESGCGKSLTSKSILGINGSRCRTSGSIRFCRRDGSEIDLLQLKPNSKQAREIRGDEISMIFQEPMSAFSPLFPVGYQMAESLCLHRGKSKEEARRIVIDMMRQVEITNAEKRYGQYPHEFSGGMLQRALIALALICGPSLLIADEPTTALDVTIQAQILSLLGTLQKELGMAILYITHDLGTVAQICDRVAVMYLGRIVEVAAVDEIFRNPIHPYTRGLIGSVHKIGGGRERLFSIRGSVPVAMNLPDRCSFYDRCDHCIGACDGSEPPLVDVGQDHFVACCLADPANRSR